MISIAVDGRLAYQPEIKLLPGGTSVCEFRLLSTRLARGEEVVEAATFFCFGEEAERFCESTEKEQFISATGVQETWNYTGSNGQRKSFVKYRLTHYQIGPKPDRVERPDQVQHQAPRNYGQSDRSSYNQRQGNAGYNRNVNQAPVRQPAPPKPGPAYDDYDFRDGPQDFDDVNAFI